ncbi:MAG: hypothetical protein ACOCZ9_02935 [Spirochaetota bacterium]
MNLAYSQTAANAAAGNVAGLSISMGAEGFTYTFDGVSVELVADGVTYTY